MNWWLFALGTAIIIVTVLDAVWTTLAPQGGGPLTARLSWVLWSMAKTLHHRRWTHRILTVAGPLIMLASMAAWIVLLWLGYFCLFSADLMALVETSTRLPPDLWGRVYFTGFTLFTLGVGDIVPQGGLWQVLTAVASVNGLFLVTLAITYMIPVASAAAAQRQLAGTVAALGMTPTAILRNMWNGENFQGLASHLAQITPMIELHAQRHLSYPMLHFFHSTNPRTTVGPRLAALDEALRLMSAATPQDVGLAPGEVQPTRRAIASYLHTLSTAFIHPRDTAPPAPLLTELEAAGIPVCSTAEWRAAVVSAENHRRLLLALVEDDGWQWSDVTHADWEHA